MNFLMPTPSCGRRPPHWKVGTQEVNLCALAYCLNLVGRRFAHQRFADSRESIHANRFEKQKKTNFEALGQIRANRVFSPIRILIRVIRV